MSAETPDHAAGSGVARPAHQHRELAESFGAIADDYDRARPR